MDKKIIDAAHTLLSTVVSTTPISLYQIKINGVPMSYSGVRVYKYYKVALNKVTKYVENVLQYSCSQNTFFNKYKEDQKNAILILENAGFETGYKHSKTQKEQAKQLCAELIKAGIIEIVEI